MSPLFDAPAVAPLTLPRHPKTGTGEAKWTNYKPRVPSKCEDCLQCAYEAMQEGRSAPLARSARHRLAQGGKLVTLVCAEHKNLRTESGA